MCVCGGGGGGGGGGGRGGGGRGGGEEREIFPYRPFSEGNETISTVSPENVSPNYGLIFVLSFYHSTLIHAVVKSFLLFIFMP